MGPGPDGLWPKAEFQGLLLLRLSEGSGVALAAAAAAAAAAAVAAAAAAALCLFSRCCSYYFSIFGFCPGASPWPVGHGCKARRACS